MTFIDTAVRIVVLMLLLLTVATTLLLRRLAPVLRARRATVALVALNVLFGVPALITAAVGHHALAQLPRPLIFWYFDPALAWHLAHLLTLVLCLEGLMLWLCVRLLLHLVRRPTRTTGADASTGKGATLQRRRVLRHAALVVPALALGSCVYGVLSSRRYVIRRMRIALGTLPPALEGLRIVHISDLHLGSYIRLEDLRAVVADINRLKPDLVVFTGDLCDHFEHFGETLRLLGQTRPRLGLYGCLGNHEYFHDMDAVLGHFQRSRVKLLRDRAVTIQHDGASLLLAGLDYAWRRRFFGLPVTTHAHHADRTLRGLERGGRPLICLAHNPNAFDALAARGADLVLSGHTHGGQVVLWSEDGKPAMPVSRKFPRFNGLYREQGSILHVTSGIGHWLPLRINCPREIALLQLTAQSARGGRGDNAGRGPSRA